MPIYEYECQKCGHQKEAWQKFSDPSIEECELCHGKMKKLISHSTFHLKGTGWYVTDYASKPSHNAGSRGPEKKKSDDKSLSTAKEGAKEETKKKPPATD